MFRRWWGARAAPSCSRLLLAPTSAASVSARATAARGAEGSRKIWKMEAAEPAGVGGRKGGSREDQTGEEEGKQSRSARHRAAAGRTAVGRGASPGPAGGLPTCLEEPLWVVLATGDRPAAAAGHCPGLPGVGRAAWRLLARRRSLGLSLRGARPQLHTHPTASPPRGAHVLPASALAAPPPARRAQLCEVAPDRKSVV